MRFKIVQIALLVILFLFASILPSHAQTEEWRATYDSSIGAPPNLYPARDVGRKIGFDAGGNVYVAVVSTNLQDIGSENPNLYQIRKYDADGNFQWTGAQFYCSSGSSPNFQVDPLGNVYVIYAYNQYSGNGWDAAIMKVNSDGSTAWWRSWNNSGVNQADWPVAMDVDIGGNVYVLIKSDWNFSNQYSNFAAQILKYDPDGNLLWEETGSTAYPNPRDIDVDDAGNAHVLEDGRVSKYSSADGALLCSEDVKYLWDDDGLPTNPTYWYEVQGVDIEVSPGGTFYLTGSAEQQHWYWDSEIDDWASEDHDNFFTAKYDSDCNLIWSDEYGSYEEEDQPRELEFDNDGDILVTGPSANQLATLRYSPDGTREGNYLYSDMDASSFDIDGQYAYVIEVTPLALHKYLLSTGAEQWNVPLDFPFLTANDIVVEPGSGGIFYLTGSVDDVWSHQPATISYQNDMVLIKYNQTVESACFDAIDNDGDGDIDCADPDCDGASSGACDTGQSGICADGTTTCQGGTETCVQDNQPETEGPIGDATCDDALDNDCDGFTDDADTECSQIQPLPETNCFNDQDDDLDGLADCGDTDCDGAANGPCDTGQPGICADGTATCQGGTETCVQDNQPQTEGPIGDGTCDDALDNDCDGFTDDEDPQCQPLSPESDCFNDQDDDLDGLVDCADTDCDGASDGPCDTGQPGICAEGTTTCVGGTETCARDNQPQTEGPIGDATCDDALDNDCDGFIDCLDDDCDCNTPPGPDEEVCIDSNGDPCNPDVDPCPACVTFGQVAPGGGHTTITIVDCPAQPEGIVLYQSDPMCVEIETTAVFDQAEICLPYDDALCKQGKQETECYDGIDNDGDGDTDGFDQDCKDILDCENDFEMFQCDPSCDIVTTSQDFENDIMCGTVTGFSLFMIGMPVDTDNDGIPDLDDNCPEVMNFFQEDTDGDDIGNACDNCSDTWDPTNQCNACTNDITNSFVSGVIWPPNRACEGHILTVYADVDGIDNGGTYGIYDTLLAFETVNGAAAGREDAGGNKTYWFTPFESPLDCSATNCSVDNTCGTGHFVLRFVDMTTPGFDALNKSTWVYKKVPSLKFKIMHDETYDNDDPRFADPGVWPLQQARAYKVLNDPKPENLIDRNPVCDGGLLVYNDCEFTDLDDGVAEVHLFDDFTESKLDELILCGLEVTGAEMDELAVDFGSKGLHHYTANTWTRLTRSNPEAMYPVGSRLYVDFGSGIGFYEYDGSWRRLTKSDCEAMIAVGSDLYVDFGPGVGFYKYDGSWTRLTKSDLEDVCAAGSDVYVDFGGVSTGGLGLYKYDGSWTRVARSDSEAMCAVGSDLYVDFGAGVGLYKYDGSWTRVARSDSEAMCAVGSDLYVDFGAGVGLYKYDGSWTRVAKSDSEAMCAVGSDLYADFGSLGIYKYDGLTWTRVTKNDPDGLCSYANKLVADFPSKGLYEYDGSWKRINSNNCEDMVAVDLY